MEVMAAYRDFLLRQDHSAVFPPHADGGDICGSDSLERILY